MSLSKYESEIKILPVSQQTAYGKFSDLRNLGALKERMNDPEVMAKISDQVPADKAEEAKKYLEQMTFDEDNITIASPVGQLSLTVVEREEPKCVKLEGRDTPLPIYVWIQLLPHGDSESRMKITVGAEVNIFMKGMVSKPLQQAADGLATILAGSVGAMPTAAPAAQE